MADEILLTLDQADEVGLETTAPEQIDLAVTGGDSISLTQTAPEVLELSLVEAEPIELGIDAPDAIELNIDEAPPIELTISAGGGGVEQVNSDWNAVGGVEEILNKPTIPSKVSDLTNDSGFITVSSFDRTELEGGYKIAFNTAYHELSYDVDGNITNVDIWDTVAKNTKLFSKVIGYDESQRIDEIQITDEVNSKVLTKTITYDVDDNIDTITKVVA